MHEAKMHQKNCYLTLTYDDEHLPKSGSLELRDWQIFAKTLRNKLGKFRYFQCGEYGEATRRAHHHALIFGLDFSSDKKPYKKSKGHQLYTSELLDELWGNGRCYIGELTFQSAAYVARYVMKKITGADALHHYNIIDRSTGEVLQERRPEFITMSKKPGIGSTWIEKFMADIYPSDEMVVQGKITRPPKFYDLAYEKKNPSGFKQLLKTRAVKAKKYEADNTPDRRNAKEKIKIAQTATLTRE